MSVTTPNQNKVTGPNGPMMSVLVRTGVKSRKAAMKQLAKSYPNCSEQHRAEIVEKWWEKRKLPKNTSVKKPRKTTSKRGRPKSSVSGTFVESIRSAIELKSILDQSKIAPHVAARIAVLVEASGGPKEIVNVMAAARQLEKVLSR